jgi:DNA-binding response OmpR family regulator
VIRERRLVVVADDDRDILELVAFRLERADYEVVQASDGQQALRLVTELRPDLAVLDVMMPKLNGYEVTREIRRGEETQLIPVILLTARVQEADVADGFEAGADDYVEKPFSPEELRARVQAILTLRAKRSTGALPAEPEPAGAGSSRSAPRRRGAARSAPRS